MAKQTTSRSDPALNAFRAREAIDPVYAVHHARPSGIKCAENDPGSAGYLPRATPEQRAMYDRLATGEPEPKSTFDHVMIDIETMSLHPHNALILSIGMIEFDPNFYVEDGKMRIGKSRLILPSIEQQLILGREVSISTQKWWQAQSKEARAHWADYAGERRSMAGVLADVGLFCDSRSRVWANGTQFDLSNLVGLNMQMGENGQKEGLWHYQAPRDMRTFVKETPAMRLIPIGDVLDISGVPHEPIYDCLVQAWQVWSHWPS